MVYHQNKQFVSFQLPGIPRGMVKSCPGPREPSLFPRLRALRSRGHSPRGGRLGYQMDRRGRVRSVCAQVTFVLPRPGLRVGE